MGYPIADLLNLTSFKNAGSDLVGREVVDNLLLAYLLPLSAREFPALEIGVFEGDSAVFIAEALQNQGRHLVLVDNLGFLTTDEERQIFIKDVVMKKMSEHKLDLSRIEFICTDSTSYTWPAQKFSFFHIDATSPEEDIESCLKLSNGEAIFAIDDFLIVPHHLEVVVKLIQIGKIHPFAIGNKKIFCSDNKEFASKIASNTKMWDELGEVLRTESARFFDHPIIKIYTQSSKFYHARMAKYQL
ncbi:class I SAM-dependent methyltransferase [Bdellovibrio sp. HCB2-146]|uniref:class I SAM-dependent methyltransferase n=1 Tax=Bdellovibrio sp. HCB2-146 TaxID=3394362 RepID=UPI0039BCFE67